jgi:hypothetical protein
MSESTKAEYKEAQDYERSTFVVPLEQFLSVEKELNELREKYDTLAVDYMLDVHKIYKQYDEAMDMLSKLSHFLGCGIGDENTTAKQFYDRIVEGFVSYNNRLEVEK